MQILSSETDNCPSWISRRERMTVENISWSNLHERMLPTRWGSSLIISRTRPMRMVHCNRQYQVIMISIINNNLIAVDNWIWSYPFKKHCKLVYEYTYSVYLNLLTISHLVVFKRSLVSCSDRLVQRFMLATTKFIIVAFKFVSTPSHRVNFYL